MLRFEAFQRAIDNGQGGSRLLRREDERRMDADSRRVTHHDQAICETGFEELDAFLFGQQRLRLLVGRAIRVTRSSASVSRREHGRGRAAPDVAGNR